LQSNGVSCVISLHDANRLALAWAKRFCSESHVAQRRRQPNAIDTLATGCHLDSVLDRLHLHATLGADKGVKLVDHHSFETGEHPADLATTPDQQCFQRLRRDQHNPAWPLAYPCLHVSGNVTVPFGE